MKKFLMSDIIFKLKYKIWDVLLLIYFKPFLGAIGRGSFIRRGVKIIGNPHRIRIGNNFKIYERCIIAIGRGKLQIGSNGLLGVGTYLNIGNEELSIGNGVAIAPYCKIFTFSHHYNVVNNVKDSIITGNITIEDDVLVGTNSVILPGVKIGEGSIIAAGSIVTMNVPPNTIYGGIPAKFIKNRYD